MITHSSIRLMVLATTALLASGHLAMATTVLYSTGFEASEGYSTGVLDGQNGWVKDNPTGASIQTTTVRSGTQAASQNAAISTPDDYALNVISMPIYDDAALTNVTISLDFLTSRRTSIWDVILVYGDGGYIGQLIIDGGHAQLGLLDSTAGDVSIAANTWNNFRLVLDFAAQKQTAYVNSTLIGSGVFANPSSYLGVVAIGLNAPGGTDRGYFDNLLVTATTAVPEPNAAALLLGGIAGLAGLRYRRKAYWNSNGAKSRA